MVRLMISAAFCISIGGFASMVLAEPVSEATVDKVCGDNIEGGCSGKLCATGCTVKEGGKLVDYGCTFPNKTGATKATCNRIVMGRTSPTTSGSDVGELSPVLEAD